MIGHNLHSLPCPVLSPDGDKAGMGELQWLVFLSNFTILHMPTARKLHWHSLVLLQQVKNFCIQCIKSPPYKKLRVTSVLTHQDGWGAQLGIETSNFIFYILFRLLQTTIICMPSSLFPSRSVINTHWKLTQEILRKPLSLGGIFRILIPYNW